MPHIAEQVHLLDEIGLNIELQNDSLINFARYIAMHDRSVLRLAQAQGEYSVSPIKRYTFADIYYNSKPG